MKLLILALIFNVVAGFGGFVDDSVTKIVQDTQTGLGVVASVCDYSEGNPKMYLQLDAAAYASIDQGGPFGFAIEVPEACAPYQHVFVSCNPDGHPPGDGKGGGYAVPHCDVHWYVISSEEREELTNVDCFTPPGCPAGQEGCPPEGAPPPPVCLPAVPEIPPAAANPENVKFHTLPPVEYISGMGGAGFRAFGAKLSFGGDAIKQHGNHLIIDVDVSLGGPAFCDSEGGDGSGWEACQNQLFSPPGTCDDAAACPCTCSTWNGGEDGGPLQSDGVSPVLISFDGHVIAFETMPTLGHTLMLGDTLPNPYEEEYPRLDKYELTAHVPVATWSYKEGDKLQLGLKLSEEVVEGTPM
jgi:hypothetical protein